MMTKSTLLKYGGIIAILAIIIPSIVFAFAAKTPQSQPSTTNPVAIKMYMQIQGASQGNIQGECVLPGHEGTIEVLSMHHQVVSSLTARDHSPLRIMKYIDKASPQLAQALINNENLVNVTLEFYRADPIGSYVHYYTIKLTNAMIISIETHAMDSGRHMEEVSFRYQKITWIDVESQHIAQDDWAATMA